MLGGLMGGGGGPTTQTSSARSYATGNAGGVQIGGGLSQFTPLIALVAVIFLFVALAKFALK